MVSDKRKKTAVFFQREEKGGTGPLVRKASYIIECVRGYDAYALDQAIKAGDGDINFQDEDGLTALHHAAADGARPCLRVLVNSGKCDYLLQDKKGRYASDLAIQWARDYAVGRLLTKHQLKQAHERGVPAWVPSGPA